MEVRDDDPPEVRLKELALKIFLNGGSYKTDAGNLGINRDKTRTWKLLWQIGRFEDNIRGICFSGDCSDEIKAKVRERLQAGATPGKLEKEFKIPRQTIRQWRKICAMQLLCKESFNDSASSVDATSMRPPSCLADLATFVCLMRFLFVVSVLCRRLPSVHASRRWPCHWLCAWRYLLHSGLAPIRTRPCRANEFRDGCGCQMSESTNLKASTSNSPRDVNLRCGMTGSARKLSVMKASLSFVMPKCS